jgi:hypothetical protein
MAFAKRPKLCPDGPAGFQQVNGLSANLDSLRDEIDLRHADLAFEGDGYAVPIESESNYSLGAPIGPFDPSDPPVPGLHDDALVARGSCFVRVFTGADGISRLDLYNAAGLLDAFLIVDTGILFFPVPGFSNVWGTVTAYSDAAATPRIARVLPLISDETYGTGLLVKTFEKQTSGTFGAMLPAHVGFFLLCYGVR